MNKAPYIISCKDLDYLKDMFDWNYGAYKSTYNSIQKVNNEEIKNLLVNGAKLFNNNMNQILNILGGMNE